jgi:Tetratricopeptide repeat
MSPKLVSIARCQSLLVCLFLFVFTVRLFCLVRLTDSEFLIPQGGDQQFYNDWALRVLHGKWTDHSAFYGLPLYAYLLAGIYKICGYTPFIPGLLQAIVEGGTAVIIYKLAVLVFGGKNSASSGPAPEAGQADGARVIGLIAAIAWAFFEPAETYSIILMPSAWAVFVFWWVIWRLLRQQSQPSLGWLFLTGVLVGFTAMGVATILFLVPLLLIALVVRWKSDWSRSGLGMALLASGVLAGASPAWVHNYFIAGDNVFLSAHSGVNFWIGNNPVAAGYPKFPPGLHAGQEAMLKDSITTAEKAVGHPLRRSEVSAYWSRQGRNWIMSHPGAWLNLLGVKIKNFWNAYQYDDLSVITTFREDGMILPGLGFGLIAGLAIPGMVFAIRRHPKSCWIAAAIFLHMASILTVFVTERYRLAAIPGLLLFAAFGLWTLWQQLLNIEYGNLTGFAGCLAGGALFVSWPQSDQTLWALDAYNSGLQALQAGHLSVAKQKLDLAYAYSPANAELNFAEGNLHLALNQRATARSYYLSALVLDQRHVGAFNNLGLIALLDNKPELAAKCFRHAIQITPNDAKLHYLLAQADYANGEMKEASNQINAALELYPEQREFKRLRAQIPSD